MPELTHRCYLSLGNPKPGAADYELFTGDPAGAAASLDRYAEAGCAEIGLDVLPADSTDAILEAIERFANDIRPRLK